MYHPSIRHGMQKPCSVECLFVTHTHGRVCGRRTKHKTLRCILLPIVYHNTNTHTYTLILCTGLNGRMRMNYFFVRSLQHNFVTVTCLVRCFFVRFFVFDYVRSRLFPRQNGASRTRTLSSTFYPFTVPSPLPTAPPFLLQKRSTYLTVLLR